MRFRVRECDLAAEKFSRMLRERLGFLLRLDASRLVLLLGDVPRRQCDLNRFPCRAMPFRDRIRGELRGADAMLLDVHSFPSGEFGNAHLAFLDVEPSVSGGWSPFVDDLNRYLRTLSSLEGARVDSAVFRGTTENDILVEAIRMGNRRNALVEINESLSDEQMRLLAGWLARAVEMAWFR